MIVEDIQHAVEHYRDEIIRRVEREKWRTIRWFAFMLTVQTGLIIFLLKVLP